MIQIDMIANALVRIKCTLLRITARISATANNIMVKPYV